MEACVSPLLNEQARRAHKRRNVIHSVLLFTGISVVLAASLLMLFGPLGLVWSALMIAALFMLGPRIPPEVVMRMYRARAVDPRAGGQIIDIVDALAQRAELPARPRLYVIPSMTLNAFAAGTPDHAVVGVTEGLLRRLTMREIAGVLAHEMSHVRNNDLWVMGLADAMTRFTQVLSYFALFLATLNLLGALSGEQYAPWLAILLLYLAPTISSLLQLGLSRTREYDADLEAAELTGDPLGLASALRRLERYTGYFWEDLMFPVPGRRVPQPSVLRSHPATEDRIKRLVDLEARPQLPAEMIAELPTTSLVGFGPIEMRPRYRWPGLWF
jgi:heat shock protein HtpX